MQEFSSSFKVLEIQARTRPFEICRNSSSILGTTCCQLECLKTQLNMELRCHLYKKSKGMCGAGWRKGATCLWAHVQSPPGTKQRWFYREEPEVGWRITCSAYTFVLHVFLLLFVLAALCALQDLSSRPGIGAASSAVKTQTPNHWTARESWNVF